MLTLIVVVLAIAFFGYHKKKGTWSYWIGICLFMVGLMEGIFFGGWFCAALENNQVNQRLTECKQENVQMKKEQETLKKEFIENGVLDDDSVSQFLEDSIELDKQIRNSDEELGELNEKLKQKEKDEFLLFFNLF